MRLPDPLHVDGFTPAEIRAGLSGEVDLAEWLEWTPEQRYLYLERRGMGADAQTALEQARRQC